MQLFAQELNGGLAGWVTAISTVGLLGPVLYWLAYKHLPGKDQFIKDLIDGFSVSVTRERASFTESLDKLTTTFKTESAAERAACEKHFSTLANAMGKGNEATIAAVKTMADQVTTYAERSRIHDERNRENTDSLKALAKAIKEKPAE